MAPTSAGTRAVAVLALVVVAFFVVDLVLLHRVVTKERTPAPDESPAVVEESKTPGGPGNTDDTSGSGTTEAAETTGLLARISELESEAAQLRATVTERFADRETIRTEAASLRVQLDETRAALEGTKAELAAAAQRETELRSERKQIADLLEKLRTDVNEANARIETLKTDVKVAQDATAAEKTRADALQKSLDEASVTLEAAKKLLDQKAQESSALQTRVSELEARVAELEAQLATGTSTGEGSGQ